MHGVGVVLSRKNAAWFGLVAIVAWTVTETFALSFRSIAVVLSNHGRSVADSYLAGPSQHTKVLINWVTAEVSTSRNFSDLATYQAPRISS